MNQTIAKPKLRKLQNTKIVYKSRCDLPVGTVCPGARREKSNS